jgi:hypothetical protein
MAITNDPLFILQNQTTDVTTSPFYLDFSNKVVVQAHGTWGGATIALQQGIITGTGGSTIWVAMKDFTRTAIDFSDDEVLTLGQFIYNQPIRAVQSGSTGTTNLTCTLQAIIGAS